MPQVLIVGASRGIGLGLVHAYARRGWGVTGTVRDKAKAPDVTATGVRIEAVDVMDAASRASLVDSLGDRVFDVVILNAGVGGNGRMGEDEAVLAMLHANAVGPAQLAYALADRVTPQTGVVAFITSQMGSIANTTSGGYDDYRASKAAQNAFARTFSVGAAQPKGIAVLSLHPGWVKTDMGGPSAPLSVEDSARGLAEVIASRSGQTEHVFLDYSGRTLPW